MQDPDALLSEIEELADRLGYTVRHAPLGDTGGTLARLRGSWVLFIDPHADLNTQLKRLGPQLHEQADLDTVYLTPQLREALGDCGDIS